MATNLDVHRGDHDLLDYCTFGLEEANDVQNFTVDTARGNDHDQHNLSKYLKCTNRLAIANGSRHKIFLASAGGVVDLVKISSNSLATMQNLVTVSHAMI